MSDYWERSPEEQANARYSLTQSARRAKADCHSMREWMENEDVLKYCKQYQLDPKVLEHIAQYTWYPIKR